MARKILFEHDFVTIKSISCYCMVSPCTVRRWIKDGKLNAIRLPGGHFRVTTQDFKDFLKQNNIPFNNEQLNLN